MLYFSVLIPMNFFVSNNRNLWIATTQATLMLKRPTTLSLDRDQKQALLQLHGGGWGFFAFIWSAAGLGPRVSSSSGIWLILAAASLCFSSVYKAWFSCLSRWAVFLSLSFSRIIWIFCQYRSKFCFSINQMLELAWNGRTIKNYEGICMIYLENIA